MSLNLNIFNAIYGLAHTSRFLDAFGVFIAHYFPYLLTVGVILLLYKEKDITLRLYTFFFVILSTLLARGIFIYGISFFYKNPRPFNVLSEVEPLITGPSTHSFPSGHATFFFALAMAFYFYNRTWGYVVGLCAFFIGIARIFVGVHWPLYVVAGAFIGIMSACLMRMLLPRIPKTIE